MSADAKAWIDETGAWNVCHDGPCVEGTSHETRGEYDLAPLLFTVETCVGVLRWSFRVYPDNKVGLVGYR